MKGPTSILGVALRVLACGTLIGENTLADVHPDATCNQSLMERVGKIRECLVRDTDMTSQKIGSMWLAQIPWPNWGNWNNWPNWNNWANWNNWLNWVKW
jgi:hypothetical protein